MGIFHQLTHGFGGYARRVGMIYLKSICAGIGAVFLSCCLFFVGIVTYLRITAPTGQYAGTIAWDPIPVFRPGSVLVVLAIFLAGFLWEFRRASR